MARILVIETNSDLRTLYRVILSKDGYEVIEAPDVNTGCMLYRENNPDLVITDMIRLERSSVRAISDLRRDFSKLKIIMVEDILTNTFGATEFALAGVMGPRRIISKPFSLNEFKEAVHDALNRN